jgi:ABC-type spermidine/putrescine transport system permease subunit I
MIYLLALIASLPEPLRIIVIIFLVVLGLLWVLLPFAVVSIQRQAIKTRELSERLVANVLETNRLLEKLNRKP